MRRTEHDDAGRVTKEIRNYEDGTPSGTDSDVTVKYEYTDGLRTKIIADLPAGSTDQETEYAYGTTKGASAGDSEIATGHLLQEVTYPDSTGATDTVTYAYNAQGQQIWTEDQAENVIEQNHDDSGRLTHQRVTTLDADFDGAVRRISTAYDSLGRRSTVTQWDNATVGSGAEVDEVKFTYEDWGLLEKSEQDRNGTVGEVGSVDDYEVSYTWQKNLDGRYVVRVNDFTLPSGAVIDFNYRDIGSRHDDDLSRVTYLEHGATAVASYEYNGVGSVVAQDYNEIDVMSQVFSATVGEYPDWDRFGRVVTSKWTKDLSTDVNFYDIDITYDRNSNITLIEDNVHSGFDVEYTMDEVDRLTQAEEGTWSGSAITSTSRDQQWTLDQVGNWDRDKLDLNGDGDWSDTDEWDDCRTHNDVNELTNRDTDCDETDEYTLAYDEVGNLTDDASDYEYEWDPFGRLRKVNNQSSALVAEYRYNALGYRIGEHVDTDDDGDVDGNDDWRYFAYDERWRMVASFLNSDTDPSEEFLHHAAGLDGRGGSSYIDLVVMRERDTDANGSLDERLYYCQNWRADVSAIIDDSGQMMEWAKYSAYGVPFGLPGGDTDSDGDCDSTDVTQIQTWIDAPAHDVRGDVDLDGDVDATDKSTAEASYKGITLGGGALSSVDSRTSFSGLSLSPLGTELDARHRSLDLILGRWGERDPIGYYDGSNLYEYSSANPIRFTDPSGTCSRPSSANCNAYGNPDGGNSQASSTGECPECPPGYWLENDPNTQPSSNGCGAANGMPISDKPGADFTDACNEHDRCYSTCGADKDACDEQFFKDMVEKCRQDYDPRLGGGSPGLLSLLGPCMNSAILYSNAVSAFGGNAFCAAQIRACRCCKYEDSETTGWGSWSPDDPFGDRRRMTCVKPLDGRKK